MTELYNLALKTIKKDSKGFKRCDFKQIRTSDLSSHFFSAEKSVISGAMINYWTKVGSYADLPFTSQSYGVAHYLKANLDDVNMEGKWDEPWDTNPRSRLWGCHWDIWPEEFLRDLRTYACQIEKGPWSFLFSKGDNACLRRAVDWHSSKSWEMFLWFKDEVPIPQTVPASYDRSNPLSWPQEVWV